MIPPDNPTPLPTMDAVDRITALGDPVIRNLQITQCYHELAVGLTRRMGMGANWCSFATWASKQAGQTIRKEDLARTLERILTSMPTTQAATVELSASAQELGSPRSQTEIQETVAEVLNPLAALDRASEAVGRGNRKVFAEIGREFARFAASCLNDPTPDSDKIAAFCEALHPGDPPDGQQYLRQAFARYYQAFFEPDACTRAQLMLLANIEIGFHEQTRLQPEIAAAMDAALIDPREFRNRLIKALFPQRGWLVRARLFLLRLFDRPSPFDRLLDRLIAEARRQAHLLITEYLMTLSLPGPVTLRLGHDVPGRYPESLKQITLPDLRALLDKIDPTPDSPSGTGTVDWSQLPERIHYILDLFRCYHETATLFDPPFTPMQVTKIKAGHLPEGRL